MPESPDTYFFQFDIDEPKQLPKMKTSEGIQLKRDKNNLVTQIDIKVYGILDEALQVAKERFKQFRNLIALTCNEVIDGQYGGHYKVTSKGIDRTVIVRETLTIRDLVSTSANSILDIERQLNIRDNRYLRQLGHFYRGKKSTDPVERYREFYQVLEDENVAFDQDEIALRHAVSHPKITHPKYAPIVENILGEPFFNPSSTKHLQIINARADKLRAKASTLLRRK